MTDYTRYLFDLDGTLVPFDGRTLYPDAAQWFADHPDATWMICTNQGGIGLRLWMEAGGFGDPGKYPTFEDFHERIEALFPQMNGFALGTRVVMCARYQSKKGEWSPLPRRGS